jgi:hypothetical protein
MVGEKCNQVRLTKPDEDGNVEQHIDRWLEGVILSLKAEPVTGLLLATVELFPFAL